ncbi:hypothetical protein pipiens_014137 [Culex pipiens pipiens]|uniref:Uncharacterized protein n=1 Tax=Culex pipiens pipiens TaxID=38569 RepID=A0ABD1CVR0_CULPP
MTRHLTLLLIVAVACAALADAKPINLDHTISSSAHGDHREISTGPAGQVASTVESKNQEGSANVDSNVKSHGCQYIGCGASIAP